MGKRDEVLTGDRVDELIAQICVLTNKVDALAAKVDETTAMVKRYMMKSNGYAAIGRR